MLNEVKILLSRSQHTVLISLVNLQGMKVLDQSTCCSQDVCMLTKYNNLVKRKNGKEKDLLVEVVNILHNSQINKIAQVRDWSGQGVPIQPPKEYKIWVTVVVRFKFDLFYKQTYNSVSPSIWCSSRGISPVTFLPDSVLMKLK